METNRIDYFFDLGSKNATNKTTSKGSGFADLLFNAMSKRADGMDQFKTTQALALQPLVTQQALDLDLGRHDDSLVDDKPAPMPLRDHHADKAVAPAPRKANAATAAKADQAGNHASTPAHADKKNDAIAKAGSSERPAEADAVDSAPSVDGAGETDTADDSQDVAIGADGDDGSTDSDSGKQSPDQQPDPQVGLGVAITAAVTDDPVPVAAMDAIAPAAAATADAATTPTDDTDLADALVAVAGMPEIGASDEEAASPAGTGAVPSTGQNAAATDTKPAVTFSAAVALTQTASLDTTDVEGQAAAVTADDEHQLVDPDNSFRRNAHNTRKADPVSQGATAAQAEAQAEGAQATPDIHAAVTQNTGLGSMAGTSALSGVAPIGFDTGLGTQTGLPGWNLQLSQGGAVRRGDFVANLRQHLQNLPVHDQVALSIQRSVRDGGGNITLQLSPTELGRIHLKLKIDEENNVQASVIVERPATLDLLQRDAKALERALQDAGLKSGPGDLSFSLQGGDPEAFARDFGSGSGSGSGGHGLATGDGVDELPAPTGAAVISTSDGWVDVQV